MMGLESCTTSTMPAHWRISAQAAEGGEQRERGGEDGLLDREAAALRIGGKQIQHGADDDLALVRLAHIGARARRQDHGVEHRLDRLAHHGLQRVARDRQAETRRASRARSCVPPRRCRRARRGSRPRLVFTPTIRPLSLTNPCTSQFCTMSTPQRRRGARVAPGDRIVARGAGAALAESPEHRQPGAAATDRAPARARRSRSRVNSSAAMPFMRMALAQRDMESRSWRLWASSDQAALAQHDVEIELLRETLVELQRKIVEPRAFRIQVIGAHDGGVAPGIAAADPAALEHRHIGDAVILRQVIGGGEAMAAAADDDDVVARFGRGVAPRGRPVLRARKRAAQQPERRIVLGNLQASLK